MDLCSTGNKIRWQGSHYRAQGKIPKVGWFIARNILDAAGWESCFNITRPFFKRRPAYITGILFYRTFIRSNNFQCNLLVLDQVTSPWKPSRFNPNQKEYLRYSIYYKREIFLLFLCVCKKILLDFIYNLWNICMFCLIAFKNTKIFQVFVTTNIWCWFLFLYFILQLSYDTYSFLNRF